MDILHLPSSRSRHASAAPTLSSSLPTRMIRRRVGRTLSAHVKSPMSSSWDYRRTRPQSSGSLDTILTYSSSSQSSLAERNESNSNFSSNTFLHASPTVRGRSAFGRRKPDLIPRQSSGSPASPSAYTKRPRRSFKIESPAVSLGIKKDQCFFVRENRRFLYSVADRYCLPSDLREFHRQDLLVLLLSEIFGGPTGIPIDYENPPKAILDVGSGDGFWASQTHEHFITLGMIPPKFTGIDVIDMAGNLRQQGVDWSFVKHNMLNLPFPFEEESFNLVHLGSMTTVFQEDWKFWIKFMEECFRILKPGGYVEMREVDGIIRRINPHQNCQTISAQKMCKESNKEFPERKLGCYPINEDTEFATSDNPFITDRNTWMSAYFDKNKMRGDGMQALSQIRFLGDNDLMRMRRVAIPFSSSLELEGPCRDLSPEQENIRKTALELFIRETESLELVLKDASEKSEEEWTEWWNEMMKNLSTDNGCFNGECWEAGNWWVKKPAKDSRFLDLAPL